MIQQHRQRPPLPRGVGIAGTGRYLPGSPLSNQALIDRYGIDTTAEWIEEHVGIRTRHFAADGTATSDIGAEAAKLALEDAGIAAEELDQILLCTTTGDWTSPAAACRVQALIGAVCPAEDKQSACASFLFGLDHGVRSVLTGMRYVMVIGADIKSRFTNPRDRRLFPIFADGAGAVILSRARSEDTGFLGCELWSDGTRAGNLFTPAGGSARPASEETVRAGLHAVYMAVDGKLIFEDAVEAMSLFCRRVCNEAGVDVANVACFIPHQANLGIMRAVGRELGISESKTIVTIDYTGNITSGTLPFALDTARRNGRLSSGDLILLTTAGAGYAAGAALYRQE